MEFTGERVIPDQMGLDTQTLIEHLARYNFALPYCNDKKVLDAACGTCYGLEILSMVARSVNGVDISKEALHYARQHYLYHDKSVELNNLDLDHFDLSFAFGLQKFDVITSFETIEHLENPCFFLESVKKALSDDGLFIFSIPLNNPSKFHKIVYTYDDAVSLIMKNFSALHQFGQKNAVISDVLIDVPFLIGVAIK